MFKSWEELSHKEQLESTFWDAYKDAHGFRPSHYDTSGMTVEELEREIRACSDAIERERTFEEESERRAIQEFEERVQAAIAAGAKNRETALRWIMDADDANGDLEYLCYSNGLPYGYFKIAA